jgi:arylsulfatase A-like enzyme
LRQHRDRPFFAKLSHYAPHSPYQARPASLARFKAKPPGAQHQNALYAACVYDLDDSLGQLLRGLAELGLDRNTVVVFTSDNGSNMSCEPLRGKKGSYYEGGIRVPFFVRWPGVTPAGAHSDVPVINQDLYPTFLALAGAPAPAGKTLDGESLVPLLRQTGGLKREAIFWHFPGYLDGPVPRGRDPVFRTRPVTTMNKDGYKLHLYHEEWLLDGGRDRLPSNRAVELYDLRRDVGEQHDLAATDPTRRDALLADLLAWLQSTQAKLAADRN